MLFTNFKTLKLKFNIFFSKKPCKKCSGDKIYYIALTVVKCFNCLKQYNLSTAPSVTNDSTLIIKQKENNTEKKTYSFRNNKINARIKSEFKPEPESKIKTIKMITLLLNKPVYLSN